MRVNAVGIVLIVTLIITCLCLGKNTVLAQKNLSNSNNTAQKENASLSNATGSIVSLQKGQDGKSTWIVTGKWQMTVIKLQKLDANQVNKKTPRINFNSSFSMSKLDGTAQYRHNDISKFKLVGNPVKVNKTNMFNGTVTVSLKNGQRTVYHIVPISINIMNNATMSMWLDPKFVENQFGDTPIYGTARVAPSTSKIRSVQISK